MYVYVIEYPLFRKTKETAGIMKRLEKYGKHDELSKSEKHWLCRWFIIESESSFQVQAFNRCVLRYIFRFIIYIIITKIKSTTNAVHSELNIQLILIFF